MSRKSSERQPVAGAFGRGQKPVPTQPTPAPAPQPTTPAPAPATTVAGKREYDDFFSLYHQSVDSANWRCSGILAALRGEAEGLYFLPLGFIPGPAALLMFQGDRVQISGATLDVKRGIKVPTPFACVAELPGPGRILGALKEWRSLVAGLGYEPSPWSSGFARRLLGGKALGWLAMAMPRFRYRAGDAEVPFGVVLLPAEAGMMLSRVYNPRGIPDVPAQDAVLTLAELKDGKGPVQKLLRTWALMEANYASRYGGPNPDRPRPNAH